MQRVTRAHRLKETAPMSMERDAGLKALQQGNATAAIPLLETACQHDPDDFECRLQLGDAYRRAGRTLDAVACITKAVQLQPGSALARYNLGIAMESGGYGDQAIEALQQALILQADYPGAREALQRIQSSPKIPPASTGFLELEGSPELPETASTGSLSSAQPVQSAMGNWAATNAAPIGSNYISPLPVASQPGGALYGSPQGLVFPTRPSVPYDNNGDGFDILQALKNWGQVLVNPNVFFSKQVGRSGMLSPVTLAVLYIVPPIIAPLVQGAQMARNPEIPAAAVHFFTGAGVLIALAVGVPTFFCIWLLFAWFVHLVGLLFQSTAPYSASFRAVIYSSAPMPILLMIAGVLTACFGIGGWLVGLMFLISGFLWCVVLLCMGVARAQQIDQGAAVGVTLLSIVVAVTAYVALYFIFFIFFVILAAALGAAASSR